jgi:hypothetical protein
MTEGKAKHKSLDGIAEYVASLDEICSLATGSLYIFENDFDSLGFDSEFRYNTLRRFLLSGPFVSLHLLAHDPGPLTRFCPRIMMLLRQFSHLMRIYQTPSNLRHITAPFAVADAQHFVRRFHFNDTRGIFVQNDPQEASVLKSRFDELWAESHPGASGTQLGL